MSDPEAAAAAVDPPLYSWDGWGTRHCSVSLSLVPAGLSQALPFDHKKQFKPYPRNEVHHTDGFYYSTVLLYYSK